MPNMENFDDIIRIMNGINKALYGVEPFTPRKPEEPTVQELTISEMTGLPIKIKKNA